MRMGKKQRYYCHIPAPLVANNSIELDGQKESSAKTDKPQLSEAELEAERVRNATLLLEPMRGECIYYASIALSWILSY